ncbi:hypothetical protein HZA96_05675 [Candidatus Woesearchaeota archaeon]|nr:hypothetical protein [Candidatus Woesearchaeota archaeon]
MHKKTTNKVFPAASIAPLYSSQLENRRYVAFEMIAEKQIQVQLAAKAVQNAFLQYVGKLQYAQAQLQYLSPLATSTGGIFRVNGKYDHYLRASFCMVDEIEKTKVIIRSMLSTGILDKAKKIIQ